MNQSAIPQSEQKLLDILHQLVPPDEDATDLPAVLALADTAYLTELFGSPLASWEQGYTPLGPTALLETIAAHPAAQQQLLISDLEFAEAVQARTEDLVFSGLGGIQSAAFPIVVLGRIIHCVWVRHFLTETITDADLEQLASLCETSVEALREQAAPVLRESQSEAILARARETRDALQAALEQHLHAGEMIHQLVESERSRSLGTLAGGIAHRFNNLLSVILGYATYVQNREDCPPDAHDALHKISDAAQQGRRLTEEILAFAGSEVEQETTCQIHDMLTSILSLLQSQVSSRIAIQTDLQAEQDSVFASPSAVHQLIFTILTHGLNHIPDGGELSVTSALDTSDAPHLCLTIAASGAPSQDEDTDSNGGTAGRDARLAQALGIAMGLNGTLTTRHDPEHGTRIEVRLPVGAAPDSAGPTAPGPVRVVPATVWVVDDDPIFRQMCEQVLADDGHQITLLESGRQLQEHWATDASRPDVLVIDFSMPEYNGLELCTWLREQGSTTPVVLVSGFSETQPDIHRALQLRKTFFLRKPFSFREILDTVLVPVTARMGHADAGALVLICFLAHRSEVETLIARSDPHDIVDNKDIDRRVVPLGAFGRPEFLSIFGGVGSESVLRLAREAGFVPTVNSPLDGSLQRLALFALCEIAVGAQDDLVGGDQRGRRKRHAPSRGLAGRFPDIVTGLRIEADDADSALEIQSVALHRHGERQDVLAGEIPRPQLLSALGIDRLHVSEVGRRRLAASVQPAAATVHFRTANQQVQDAVVDRGSLRFVRSLGTPAASRLSLHPAPRPARQDPASRRPDRRPRRACEADGPDRSENGATGRPTRRAASSKGASH